MDEYPNERHAGEDPINSQNIEWAIEEYANRLYAVALRITGSPEDAEDALQEAFLAAVKSRDTFRADARASTWLHRITVNAALQYVRARKPVVYLTDDGLLEAPVRDWSIDLEAEAEREEVRAQIARGLQCLDPDLRAAVILRDVEGFSAGEAAEILDCSEAALKARLHRGRLLLRRHLVITLSED